MSRLGRPFALLWAGQSASLVGDALSRLALPLVAVLGMRAPAGQVATLAAVEQVPFLLLALPAGVWVTRIGLRRSMIISDVCRGAAIGSVPITALFTPIGYGQLLVTAAVVGVASVPFQLAYQSVVPSLVPGDLVPAANRRLTLSESLAGLLGPALAGVLVGLVGAARTLGVDVASYLVSLITLAGVRSAGPDPVAPGRTANRIAAGVRYVLADPPLRALMWASAVFNAGFAGYQALMSVFAVRTLGISPGVLGFALAVGGVAVPLGVLLSRVADVRWGRGKTLVLAAALSAVGPFVVAGATTSTGPALLAAGTFVTGVGGGCWGVAALTTRQLRSTGEMRVQTTATHRFVSLGVLPLGAGAAGLLADAAGTRTAIIAFAVLGALAVLPLVRVPMRAYTETISGADGPAGALPSNERAPARLAAYRAPSR